MNINWEEVTAIAGALSGIALVATLLVILSQLREQGKEQFVGGTAATFETWMDDDFQKAQQWVLYDLKMETWREFVAEHRGKYGERAFIRVGSFYNRVGYLVTRKLLGGQDRLLLDTLAGPAIAVWQKMQPLVLEARLIENSLMFQDYQRMLPRCYECYVPTRSVPPDVLSEAEQVADLSGDKDE